MNDEEISLAITETLFVLTRQNGWYSIKQPSHDLSCGPFKPHSAGAKVTAKLPDGINIKVTFEPKSDINTEATPKQEEQK